MPTPPPPYGATWITTDGDWSTAANWLESDPNTGNPLHYVPGVSNSVSFGGSSSYTVTYNTTDEIWSLGGFSAILDINGGSLTIDHDSFFSSTINVASGATLSQAAGSTLTFINGAIAGTLAGAGTIQFEAGTVDINSGALVTVSNWTLGVAGNGAVSTTVLNESLSYAGNFLLNDVSGNNAVLNLNHHKLTVSGPTNLNGTIEGPGTLLLTKTASGSINAQVTGGALVEIKGTLDQTGNVGLGGTLQIDTGGQYVITAVNVGIGDNGGASIVNNGTLQDSAGGNSTNAIAGNFTNNGTLSVLPSSTLNLEAGTITLGGTISGGGTLLFGFAANATINSTNVTVGTIYINGGNGGGTFTVGTDLAYGGTFTFANQFGALDLNGHTLMLSAASSFAGTLNGAGTLKVTGTGTVGFLSVGTTGAPTIEDAGTMTQNGFVNLHGTLQIDSGATYTFTSPNSIIDNGATTINNGTLTDDSGGGTSSINGIFTNNGTLSIAAGDGLGLFGTDTLNGTISGAGTLGIGAGNQAIDTANVTVAAIYINGGNGGGTLTLGTDLAYGGTFTFANQFGALDLNGHTLTLSATSSFAGALNGGGTLKVTGTGSIGFLSVGGAATIEDAGTMTQSSNLNLNGKLQIDSGASYTITSPTIINDDGATTINNGTLTDDSGGGNSSINGIFTNNGTLAVAAGDGLTLSGTVTLNGTISGAGALGIGAGNEAIDTADVTIGSIYINGGNGGGTLTLGTDLTYGGSFTFANQFGTLNLNGHTLTLTGASAFQGGLVSGGALAFAGGTATISIGGVSSTVTAISESGSSTAIDIETNFSYGGTFTQSAGTVFVDTGDTLTLDGTASLAGTVSGPGTLAITGGTATLKSGASLSVANLSISGASTVVTLSETLSYGGHLTLGAGATLSIGAADTLTLTGTSTLGGTLKGGSLVLGGGTVALDTKLKTSHLTVAGADVTLGLAVTYAGIFAESSGTVNLNGHNLTLSGATTFTGGTVMGAGSVMLRSASTIDGVIVDGGAMLSNFAVASENGPVVLGDSSGGFGKIMNQANATFDFLGDGSVTAAAGGSGAFSNLAPTSILEKTGGTGTSLVGVNIANGGEILVNTGTLEIGGNVTGSSGTLAIEGAASLQFDKSVATGQALTFSGSGGDLVLGKAASFAATIAGFGAGDEIDALHFGLGTTVGFVENGGNTGGTLTIANGGTQAQLALLGQYSAAGFGSTSTGQGTVITYTPPPSASDSIASLAPAHG
jgi:hypothetical protein